MAKKRINGEGTYSEFTRKNKSGKEVKYVRYVVSLEDGSRKPFTATGTNARKKAREKFLAWDEARKHAPEIVVPDITLSDWMKMYLQNCRKGTIKETSYHQLELLSDELPESLQKKPVKDIAPIELQSFINSFAKSGSKHKPVKKGEKPKQKGASRSYVNKMVGLIKSAFAEAVENDICSKNPARKLKTPFVHQDPKQSFTLSEFETICKFAETYHQDIQQNVLAQRAGLVTGAAVVVLLCTGIRRGELLGLKWGDVEDNKLHIRRAVYMQKDERGKLVPHEEEYSAKTEKSLRTIPFPLEAQAAIGRLKHRGIYIFASGTGTIMRPDNFNRSYKAFMKNLREEYPEVRALNPHECRHTFATLSQDAGADMRTVQLILGHTNIQTTAEYTHPDFVAMEDATAGLLKSALKKPDESKAEPNKKAK